MVVMLQEVGLQEVRVEELLVMSVPAGLHAQVKEIQEVLIMEQVPLILEHPVAAAEVVEQVHQERVYQ